MPNRVSGYCVLAAVLMLASVHVAAHDLYSLWRDARGGEYRTPDVEELNIAEALFVRQLEGETGAALNNAWQRLGFHVVLMQVADGNFVVVHERAARKNGRGFYVFNSKASGTVVLQAPHSYKDRYTGELALKFFAENRFAAVALNSVPRSASADVAHLSQSYFNAFSRAYARVYPQGRVIQLHGFAQEKRRTPQGRGADVILSAASRWASATVRDIGNCLPPVLPETLRIYPRDVSELGGLRNANAAMLRAMGFDGFAHVEISKPLRQRLRDNATLRTRFAVCFNAETL